MMEMLRILAVVLTTFLVVSCRAKVPGDALLPPETPLFVKEGVGYGVVSVSFAHVLERLPPVVSGSTGLIRKGSVVTVVERRAVAAEGESTAQLWVFVEAWSKDGESPGGKTVSGWLPGESLDFYDNLPKAQTASALMPR
jgi:hypothetical protein